MFKLWFAFILLISYCNSESVPTNNCNGFGYELLLARMDSFEHKVLEMLEQLKKQCEPNLEEHPNLITNQNTIGSCEEEHSRKSGPYMLAVGNSTIFKVYCEQNLLSGGWIVIQNRFDGSVDFYRNWTDYRNGFGNLSGEFWLGLEKIHLLTSVKPRLLLVYLENFDGVSKFAVYDDFSIGNENEKYVLKSVTRLYGTLDDSLAVHKGNTFTTRDVDSAHCVKLFLGAWWNSRQCYYSNLNGPYLPSKISDTRSMNWHGFSNDHESLKVSKMMIK